MIRREILATTAVVAVCFAVGQPTPAPVPLAEVALPTVIAEAAVVAPEQAEAARPFLSWPELQPANPTLTWPPSGCDAGSWSVGYATQNVSGNQTEVRYVAPRGLPEAGQERRFVVNHHEGWKFALHPVTPQSLWAVAHEPKSTAYLIKHLDGDGSELCSLHEVRGAAGFGEVRAQADVNGIRVYRRNPRSWAVDQYDENCRFVDQMVIPGQLADPMRAGVQKTPSQTLPIDGFPYHYSAIGRVFSLQANSAPFAITTLTAEEPIQKFIVGAGRNGLPVAFWDEHKIYLHVLGAAYQPVWSLELPNQQPWQDAVVALEFADGYLSVRGGLDDAPWNAGNEWIRVYDTRTGELVGQREVEHVAIPAAPPRGEDGRLARCDGGGGLWGGCDGAMTIAIEQRPCFYTGAGCWDLDRQLELSKAER